MQVKELIKSVNMCWYHPIPYLKNYCKQFMLKYDRFIKLQTYQLNYWTGSYFMKPLLICYNLCWYIPWHNASLTTLPHNKLSHTLLLLPPLAAYVACSPSIFVPLYASCLALHHFIKNLNLSPFLFCLTVYLIGQPICHAYCRNSYNIIHILKM